MTGDWCGLSAPFGRKEPRCLPDEYRENSGRITLIPQVFGIRGKHRLSAGAAANKNGSEGIPSRQRPIRQNRGRKVAKNEARDFTLVRRAPRTATR